MGNYVNCVHVLCSQKFGVHSFFFNILLVNISPSGEVELVTKFHWLLVILL